MSNRQVEHGPGRWPASDGERRDSRLAHGWLVWDGMEPPASDPEKHSHAGHPGVVHRHRGGGRPHDHYPPGGTL